MFGKDWEKVSEYVGSRSRRQISNHGYYLRHKFREHPNAEGANLLWVLDKEIHMGHNLHKSYNVPAIANRIANMQIRQEHSNKKKSEQKPTSV